MNRRGFLRLLGLGTAAAAAPTKAYSFLGNILRPRRELVDPRQFERLINPPLTIQLQMSNDMVNWTPYRGPMKMSVVDLSRASGIVDASFVVSVDDIIDVGRPEMSRYVRVQHQAAGVQPGGALRFWVGPEQKGSL